MAIQNSPPTINLRDALQDIAVAQSRVRDTRSTEQENSAENERLRAEQVQAAEILGQLSQNQQVLDSRQQLEAEARKKAAAEAFGTDILDPNNRIAYLAREQAAQVDNMIEQTKYAQRLMNSNPLDSPLDYFVHRTFVGDNINAAKASQDAATKISGAIDNLNRQTQATVETQSKIQETFTQEEAAIAAQVTALKAADAVRMLRMNQNKEQAAELSELVKLDTADVNYTVTAYKLQREAEEFDARMEERRNAKKDKQDLKHALDVQWKMYNVGAKALNKPQIPTLDMFVASWNAFKGSEIGKSMGELINHGGTITGYSLDATARPGMENYIGATPGESYLRIREVQGSMPQGAERTANYIQTEAGFALADLQKSGTKITPDLLVSEINKRILGSEIKDEKGKVKEKVKGSVAQMYENAEQDLHAGRVKNIFRVPDANTIATSAPKLAESNWWKELVAPIAAVTPNPTVDQLLKQGQLALKEGKITPEEIASGVVAYVKAGNRITNATGMYKDVGIRPPETYPVAVQDTIFDTTRMVNALDEAKVLHLVVRNASVRPFGFGSPFGFN